MINEREMTRPSAPPPDAAGERHNALRQRPRRLRRTPGLRDLLRETRLGVSDLVLPVFITEETDDSPASV
jgi:delta-aminolevulinic acid dehydratase/porphobilinogen synthase